MDTDLIITLVGLVVAGLAAVLGIWVERDKEKPPRYAYALSILILLATIVGMYQCYSDAKQNEKLEADMARMLQMLDKIAANTEVEIPELEEFVNTEIAAQSRSNPAVVAKLAQRVADEGGDPGQMLSKRLPASDVEGLQRKGELNVKPPAAGIRPTISLGPRGDGSSGARRPRLVMKKNDGDAPAEAASAAPAPPTVPAAASADAEAPKDASSLLPKGSIDLKGAKPSLGAKPDGTAKAPAVGPTPPKVDGAKPLGTKPKL
jgi:hypothetical protein